MKCCSQNGNEISPRILVVDDEKEASQLLQRFLTTHGFKVEIALNGKQAQEKIQECPPQCILADIKMPVMGGDALLAWMKLMEIPIPVIMMTGVMDKTKAEECCRLGASHYLVKPLDLEEVYLLINKTLSIC